MENEKITMYVTKYLWTRGIEEIEGVVSRDGKTLLLGPPGAWYTIGLDAYYTLEDARARAEYLRVRRIAKLEKELQATKEAVF